jgi:hypothetical protein
MQNARLGVIYLWQGTEVQASTIESIIAAIGRKAGTTLGLLEAEPAVESSQASLWEKIKGWAQEFVEKVWAKIKEVFGNVGVLGGHLKKIALFLAKKVFASAAPIIGSVTGLVEGLWKTTVAFCEKLGNWIASKGVNLVKGHPETLIKGIESGLNRALLEGLYETAKSSLLLGLNIASYGAASIIETVAGLIETVTKMIWRFAERCAIRLFCSEAKGFWNARSESNSIHFDSMKFDNWLRGMTNKVPVVAAVTLGTGIAGDKMRFLQMYTGEGMVISQSQFDNGVKYLDQMKRTGSRVMERSELEFESDDPTIAGLLKLAKSHDEVKAKTSFWRKLFRTTDKIMRA